MNHTILWENLTWPEVPDILSRCGHTALLPIGATEQHGPHLGLGTDSFIARALCEEVSKHTATPVLPVLPIGCSMGHSKKWPGTLSLRPTTLIALLSDLGEWLLASGVRRLFLVNGHVSNHAPLRCALEELRLHNLLVALVNVADVSPEVSRLFSADANDWHANAAETSLLLHLAPTAVRTKEIPGADDPDRTLGLQFAHPVHHTSRNGVTGRPSEASSENGRKLFQLMVEALTTRILAARHEDPPLS